MLGTTASLSAVLYTWGIDHSVYHTFYAAAVRSMTDNPVAFFFGSFDPGNSITLDKEPGFLWPQALSAMVFGFHPWALVLPQAVEGVACVLLLHLLVRRWAGIPAGLLAAGFLALTPVAVGLGRSVVEDAPFVLLLLLAAEATWRAAARARLRTLLTAGVWAGAAFQCKMLEAWAVLPALAVTYLVAAPTTLRRRIGHAAAAGALAVAVSVSWVAVASVVPAQSRPYMDGTTDNSAVAMVVGYNFLTRFTSLGVDAAATGSVVTGVRGPDHTAGGSAPGNGTSAGTSKAGDTGRTAREARQRGPRMGDSVLKMFSPGLATQTGWLYPLAACGLLWGLAAARRRRVPRTDPSLAGYLMWGVWLATFFAAFSFGSVTGHTYYMGVVAVALAALSGAGLMRAWEAYRAGGRHAWVLAAVTTANVLWATALTLHYHRFFGWLAPTAAGLCILSLVITGAGRAAATRRPRTAAAALATALAAVLLIPAAWSVSALSPRYNQPGGMGRVGPTSLPGSGGANRLTPPRTRLLAYLTAHRHGAKYLAAMPDWADAAPYIISADASMLPMGGFTHQVPYPTPDQLARLVDSRELHFIALPATPVAGRQQKADQHGATARHDATAQHTDTGTSPTMTAITRWVTAHCTPVPPTTYDATASLHLQLYHCNRETSP
ncbi:glycosyltransferase family 39 protein [Streptomyces sp. Li-HN-5-11]|uniref:ArnT family glycosyltransferase n=1 Tax=Streptomyces sp. Li-HN-5-11 TaxID=3075432 RepID=UPI0028A8F09D|nr:glycosyltransferase family 39 protein [Streptomyces sp. Li-HN-5-11]WNM32623.1 glycosyltransferase family 39 protein [Streptomyces sp. Li-HN-5-11]